MNDLVEIQTIGIGSDINSVNARELHEFLGAKTQYSHWIKNRIRKFGFTQDQDYIMIETKKEGNNATIKEYYITLDMAKELSMVENNPRGREARRYFIEIEKKHREQPQLTNEFKTQNVILTKKNQILQKMIDELITENTSMALPLPPVDLEPYKAEIKRLNDRVNEEYNRAEHFSHMAGVQVFKTVEMMSIKDKLIELQAEFLNNPTIYSKIGDYVRSCTKIQKDTQENSQFFKIEVV